MILFSSNVISAVDNAKQHISYLYAIMTETSTSPHGKCHNKINNIPTKEFSIKLHKFILGKNNQSSSCFKL
jgi:hypothetical protein